MSLPTFRSLAARRNQRGKEEGDNGVLSSGSTAAEDNSEETPYTSRYLPRGNIRLATRTRRNWIIASCLFFFIAVIFLILTIIGNISDKPVIRSTYFFKLNLTNIIPSSVGDIILVNSLARSLGLHDFYQVGLWSFCEGYNDEGITHCSPPASLYWFNPVAILLNELLAGATIALPAQVTTILRLIRLASHFMFGFFLTGISMTVLSIFLAPLTMRSRWWSLPVAIWTFVAALLTTVASAIGTAMAVVFRNVLTSQPGLNISCALGTTMLAFMWTASAFTIFGWLVHAGMCCCCASQRDVRTGRRKGRASAYREKAAA